MQASAPKSTSGGLLTWKVSEMWIFAMRMQMRRAPAIQALVLLFHFRHQRAAFSRERRLHDSCSIAVSCFDYR